MNLCFSLEVADTHLSPFSFWKTPTAVSLSYLSLCISWGCKGDHSKYAQDDSELSFEYHSIFFLFFCWLHSHFTLQKQLEAGISPVLAQHSHKARRKVPCESRSRVEKAVVKVGLRSLMWWAYWQSQISQKAIHTCTHTQSHFFIWNYFSLILKQEAQHLKARLLHEHESTTPN